MEKVCGRLVVGGVVVVVEVAVGEAVVEGVVRRPPDRPKLLASVKLIHFISLFGNTTEIAFPRGSQFFNVYFC